MTKEEFLAWVRTWGAAYTRVSAQETELLRNVRKHDPTLADMFQKLGEQQRAIGQYCLSKIETAGKAAG